MDGTLAVALAILLHVNLAIARSNSTGSQELRKGWVSQPDGRGTYDILFSCLVTVFLCTWTCLHLNVPAVTETYWQQFRRKCRWMAQTIVAPEGVLIFAAGQKVDAKRSVAMFKKIGCHQWTVRHGFYANMGGFHLKAPDYPQFPITARQLCYLVRMKYTTVPPFTAKDIWDKSKADGFQKLFTCLQTGWFIVQCIGRAMQQLPITTLELSTLGFVFCTLVMYFQWANKPLDVARPTVIKIDHKIADILILAGAAASKPYRGNPLDFIDDGSPSWLTDVQPHLRFQRGPRERPLPRLTNDRFPVIGASLDAIILFICSMIYCALHFAGWNFTFPTLVEKTLWRASSITLTATAFVGWVCETIQDGRRIGRWSRWHDRIFPPEVEVAVRLQLSPIEKQEIMFIPCWEVVVLLPVFSLYTLARTYIVAEIFLSQRSLPAGAFDTVNWSKYIPHW